MKKKKVRKIKRPISILFVNFSLVLWTLLLVIILLGSIVYLIYTIRVGIRDTSENSWIGVMFLLGLGAFVISLFSLIFAGIVTLLSFIPRRASYIITLVHFVLIILLCNLSTNFFLIGDFPPGYLIVIGFASGLLLLWSFCSVFILLMESCHRYYFVNNRKYFKSS